MNAIDKAIRYVKEPAELERTLKQGLYTADLINDSAIFTGTNTVKYFHTSFENNDLGDFDIEQGYSRKGIVGVWKDMILTQDKGDSLIIDRFEDEESTAQGIVTIANRYILKVQAPALDVYRYNKIVTKPGVTVKELTLDTDNILDEVLEAFAVLKENDINTDALLMYITPTAEKVLRRVTANMGYFNQGVWNNEIDTEVELFDTAKLKVVPSNRLGEGVQFILLHKDAAPSFEKYTETEFFDRIPGFGNRRMQADIGIYHDAFVYDELVKAVYVSKVSAG